MILKIVRTKPGENGSHVETFYEGATISTIRRFGGEIPEVMDVQVVDACGRMVQDLGVDTTDPQIGMFLMNNDGKTIEVLCRASD